MWDTVTGMIFGAAALAFSQLAMAWFSPRFITPLKQKEAKKRFDAEPRVYLGATYKAICRTGTDTPIVGRCRVVSLETGRIELELLDGEYKGCFLPMTLVEFEAFYPISE